MVELLHIVLAENIDFSYERGEHLGFAYLAAALRRSMVTVKIEEVHGFNDLDKIVINKPSIIGVSPFIHEFASTANVCMQIKELLPNTIIVWGGVPTSSCVKQILQEFGVVDVIIHGDGEAVLVELALCIENKKEYKQIAGIAYREGSKIVINPNRPAIMELDELPKPEHDMLNNPKITFARVAASRGCYGYCTFCSAPHYFNREIGCKWRGHSINYVVDEMWDIYNRYHIREFFFSDASIEDPPGEKGIKRLEELADRILSKEWDIFYHVFIRGESFGKEHIQLIHRLACSGLEKVFIGVEAVTEHLMKLFQKRASLEQCIETYRIFRDEGILVEIGFIFFTPFSCMEDLIKQADFLHKMGIAGRFSYFFTQLEIYPDTPIKKILKQEGLLKENADYKDIYCYNFRDAMVKQVMQTIGKLKMSEMFSMLRDQSNTEIVLRRIQLHLGQEKTKEILEAWLSLQVRMNDYYFNCFMKIIHHVIYQNEESN